LRGTIIHSEYKVLKCLMFKLIIVWNRIWDS
jgi:hypothetical protein